MPGWYASTRTERERGALEIVGVVLEQHPDRARLFMQWHELDFPLLVDAADALGASVVPITALVDERGVVRATRVTEESLAAFLDAPPLDARPGPPPARPGPDEPRAAARFADGTELDAAITALRTAAANDPDDGAARFALGVALRRRHDGPSRRPDDFAGAIAAWQAALALDPNQYVWRRRIQQYGPRLDKPYSFYDWVSAAREAIRARGEEPLPLHIEPAGAELAFPARGTDAAPAAARWSEADAAILADATLLDVRAIRVPSTDPRRRAMRLHLHLAPTAGVTWSNDTEPPQLLVAAPEGWTADPPRLLLPGPADAATDVAPRRAEIELVAADADAASGRVALRLLFDVCLQPDGTCLRRRIDLELPID